jgi:hypothetical protein
MVFSFRCVSGPGALPDKSNLGLATIKYKASDVYHTEAQGNARLKLAAMTSATGAMQREISRRKGIFINLTPSRACS